MDTAIPGEVEGPALAFGVAVMLPEIYRDASLRNTTPVCPTRDRLGVGFELADGTVVRLALDPQECAHLAEMLVGCVKSAGFARQGQEQGEANA